LLREVRAGLLVVDVPFRRVFAAILAAINQSNSLRKQRWCSNELALQLGDAALVMLESGQI
jgi:hypothetical protein